MQLIMSPASPYVRKVRVLIREAGLNHQITEVAVTTSPMAPASEALAANPTGKIPSLVREDAPALYDSRVICRFLDDRARAELYPDARVWDVLTLEATGDAMMDAAVGMTYQMRFVGTDGPSADWLDAQWAKFIGAITALEERWMGLLTGPVNAGQISVACALGYADLRHDARGWRDSAGTLADWYAEFAERPSMLDTRPE